MLRTIALVLTFGALMAADAPAAKPYPLDTCPVSGEKLDTMGGAVVKVYAGQEIKFCCKGCVKTFEKDLDANLVKVAAAKPATAAAAK